MNDQTIDNLIEACEQVERYSKHRTHCAVWQMQEYPCTCGLQAAKDRAEGAIRLVRMEQENQQTQKEEGK